MKDYFDSNFDFEDFNDKEWLDKLRELFNKEGREPKYGKSFWDSIDDNDEYTNIEDIDDVQGMNEFKAEDLLDPDSMFSEIMEKLERIKFEKSMDDNFKNIKEQGIDILDLKTKSKEDIKKVVETIDIMNKTYLDREEYEKCAVLRPIINKIKLEIKL